MKRRFVICIDDSTKQQQDTVTQFLKEKGVGYWHWFSDMWLMTDINQSWTATKLRDELNSKIPGAHTLVVQIDGSNTWSGFGNPKMFNWLKSTWKE